MTSRLLQLGRWWICQCVLSDECLKFGAPPPPSLSQNDDLTLANSLLSRPLNLSLSMLARANALGKNADCCFQAVQISRRVGES
ncbi:hypothetical protein CCR75_002160 [Bremia lactucae]|uniref:Uncharacterized protein n=1 Tax=Bremia lactucae TaxID=4779 RepID=A0A976FIQ2_BRELC|nr:hypothetical protein CCR75_002160 [Bremia lactucae]